MFKRKLFKRALPFILSVAMMFESLPATAMATESSGAEQMTETERQSEEGGEERSGSGSEESAEAASTEERLSEESSGSESGSESEEAPTSEESSGSESGSESEASTPSGSETPSTSEEWSESGSESETPSTSEESSGSEHEDEREEIEQKEVDAEETANPTKLDLNDEVGVGDNKIAGFTRVYGELPLTFTTEYGRNEGCGKFQEDLKGYIDILVDDEKVHDTAKANFSFKWTGKKKDAAEGTDAYTEAVDGVPTNVGEYKLHITLAEEKDIWREASMDVYVKIQPAELELVLDKTDANNNKVSIFKIDPGKTVKDLKDQITKDYDLKYEDNTLVDDKTAIVEKFAVTVREAGAEADLEDTAVLNAKTGYEVRITIDFKEKINYNVTTEQYYKVEVGDLQETRVEAVLDGVAYPVTKVYGDASTALTDLFAKTAKVFVVNKDGDDKELTAAEGETLAVPGWYRREQVKDEGKDGVQEDGSIYYAEEPGLKYVKLAEGETPEEAGEYYVIWVYAGDDKNAYKASASDPVAATIEPAPVVIRIANDSEALGSLFHEGMREPDVKKALKEIEYKVSTVTDGKVNDDDIKTDDFFGVTYSGDDENPAEQYYKPLFKLQRAVSKEKDKVIEEKDREWSDEVCPAANNGQLVNSDDDHEYVYRVIFTGNKVMYTFNGAVSSPEPITDVATNAANRNYLAKVDTTTLEENAVEVKMAATKKAVIDYAPIVKAFNDTYKNPTVGTGEAGSPAVKVYDENALFANRAAYKQAQVKDGSNVVASATDGLTYTWRSLPLADYDAYMEKTPEQKEEAPLENENWQIVTFDDLGSTEVDNGDFVSTAPANVYQLTIEYKDPEHNYWAKAEKVYFKVEKQQVVIVPGAQVAQDGQKIIDWRDAVNAIPGLDKSLAKAYKIPNNVKAEYDAVGEDKTSLEVTLPENTVLKYEVQNKEKNADGSNKDNYVETTHDIFDNKVGKYEYGVVATLDGVNYTTQYESEGVKEDYTELSEIKFIGESRLYVDIDMTKIPQDKQYDGEAITLPDGLVKIYSDQDMAHEITSEILNTTSEYDPEKVNLYWHKTTNNQQTDIHDYTTEDVIWGGEYTLALRFKGNETYRPITENVGGPADGQYYTYGDTKVFKNQNNDYTFKITPRDITITPQLKTDVKAGETVDKLLVDGLAVEGDLVEKDRVFFEHAEFATGTFGDHYINFDKENGYFPDESVYQYAKIDKYGGYPAFKNYKPSFKFQVNDKEEIKDENAEYLRFGSKYAVKLDNALNTPLAESYNVTWNPASLTVSERGQGKVTATVGQKHSVALKYAFDGSTYTIKPREAAPFVSGLNVTDAINKENKGTNLSGNFISYNIYAPTEFENDFENNKSRFFFAEAVANAGGYVLADWTADVDGDHYITVLFPVTEEDKVRTFNIIWEEGYTETFQFEGVELEADLTKAVAPKTIKFNGVQSKMAVGETQQLDVKITKRQLGDVIKLQYRIAGTANETKNQFISVDPDTGIVTALHTEKKATTQIEAYPVYLENGKYVEITGKGVKTAKTKITVSDVTAPSIKKVIPQDETVKVQFTDAGNGYRREIYVIEAKKAKVTDFESRIAGMQNNQWEKAGFAVAPVYSYATSASKNYDAKTKLIEETVRGLVPGTNYVVYVRNVSAARQLDDGSQVDLSFKGAVKNFVAVKSQVQVLEPYFNVDPETNTPIGKSAVKYLVTGHNPDGSEIFDATANQYEVDLLSKSAQISVNGLFFEKYDGNTAAEDKDKRRYALPLTKPLQANYYNPKLTYGVFDAVYDKTNGEWTAPAADPWTDGVAASKYATISNKGKITFKATSWNGAKTVYIYVKADTTDDPVIDVVSLKITANPTSVTGKKAKLKVGDDRELAEFLQYKQGKKKVPEYKSTQISISDEMIEAAAQAGYKIYDTHDFDIEDGELSGGETTDGRRMHRLWHIVAMSPNKAPFNLTITDRTADGIEMTATVTLTAAALDPVKNLKKSYVDDKNITINFKHAGNPYGYEIALMDARKNVVSKKFVKAVPKDATSNMETWEQKRQSWIVAQNFNDVTKEWGKYELEYFAKTDTFAYTIHNEKLVRLSSYTVSVTPVYDAQKGKTVTTKVKTTNIPAARNYNVDAVASGKGGITIKHAYAQSASTGTNVSFNMVDAKALTDMPYFQSGNTYTLVADDTDNTWSKDRTTDKLTWKSSNTKVATIKANPGTYTATFKAVKAGDTTITVTSKITKKVIARYDVRVKAVGNGNGFSGGYEPTDDDTFYKNILAQWDPFYDGRLEVLSATDMLTVNADSTYDRTWVSFTAPTYGQYTFKAMVDSIARNIDAYNGKNGNIFDLTNNGDGTYTATLEAGQKLYFKLNGSFTLEVVNSTSFARLTTANTASAPLDVKVDKVSGWIAFTAPEDNVYKFVSDKDGLFGTPKQDNKDTAYDSQDSETTLDGKTTTYYVTKGLKAGETLFIKVNMDAKLWVERREVPAANTLVLGSKDSVSDELTKDKMTVYAKFTALETGKYTFETETKNDADKNPLVKAEIYAADGNTALSDGGFTFEPGKKTAIAALNEGEAVPEKPETTKNTVSVYMEAGDTVFVKFEIPKEDIERAFGDLTAADQSKNDKKDNKYSVSVKVSSDVPSKMTALELGKEQTVTKETTKTFKYTVAEDGKYEFKITNAEAVKYFNDQYEEVADRNSMNATITVDEKNDKAKVKVGDTIYVEVKAIAADDAKVVLSKVGVNALTAGTPAKIEVTGNDSAERWYTFTALEEGVYTFDVAAVQNTKKEGEETVKTDTHIFTLSTYGKVFGTPIDTTSCDADNPYTNPVDLKAGQTVIFTVAPSLNLTIDPAAKPEDVKTTINVSVNKMDPEAISTGDKGITLAKANDEVIYKFTAVDTDDYNIKWTKDSADATATNATITVSTSLTKDFTQVSKKALYAGQTLYIKATANADNAKGTLSITAAKADTTPLKSGEAKDFNFEKKLGSKTYSYIAPADGAYGILVKLAENAGALTDLSLSWEDYSTPVVTLNDVSINGEGYAPLGNLEKGQTIKITLSSNINTTDDVKGSITIQPTTPETATPMTGNSVEAKVTAGKNAYYAYTIPAYGRYGFTLSNADVDVKVAQKKTLNGTDDAKLTDVENGYLFNKNDVVYLTVGTSKATEQTATLKVEPLANVETLAAETEKGVTIGRNGYVFYQFKAPDRGEYTFNDMTANTTEVDGVPTSKSIGTLEAVYKYDDTFNKNLAKDKYNNLISPITLDKDQLVLIVLKANNVDDTDFKYTIRQKKINVLTEGAESKVKIKDGESATFEFPILNEGMYAFSVVGEGMTTSLMPKSRIATANGDHLFGERVENTTYVVKKYEDISNAVQKFTVSYTKPATPEAPTDPVVPQDDEPVAEAEVTIKVTKVEPVVLKADDAEKSIEINKGECAIVSFIPAVSNRYAFTTGNPLVLGGFTEAVLDKGSEAHKNIILTVKSNDEGNNKKETAKVKVTTVKPEGITGSPAAFKATGEDQTFWYEFKASKNARYDFEVTNGKDAEGEKVTHTSCTIEEFKNIRDDDSTAKALSSKLMKKDDTVLIKVTVKGLAKDTDVKFNIKETEVAVFEEVVFKSTSGLTITRDFTAKKDELYTVTVEPKSTTNYKSVKAVYTDKDKKEQELAVNTRDVELANIEGDTKVSVTIEVASAVEKDTVFYIFVEKKAKPAPEPEPSKPETPDQTETSSETPESTEPEVPSETPDPADPESPEVPESPDDTTTPEA